MSEFLAQAGRKAHWEEPNFEAIHATLVRSTIFSYRLYDKFLIIAFESDTMKTSLVHCLKHCYSCYVLTTIRGNQLVIFPGIALKSNDKTIVYVVFVIK